MNFGQAIEALKNSKKVARKGWNGKGMFVYYVPAGNFKSSSYMPIRVINLEMSV